MRNIFLEKSYTKRGGEAIPGPLSKKSKLRAYLWINSLNFCVFFIVRQVEGFQNIPGLSCRPFIFTSLDTFFWK